jgi:hypothetical protein
MLPKTRYSAYVLATLLISFALTGCACGSKRTSGSLQGSPRILRLEAATPVQTKDGLYNPQQDETWHSQAEYLRLEQEVLMLSRAAQARDQNR